jgi:hypothetical protein
MAMRVLYLDVDDEITSAAARIRGAEGARVAIVLPYGSRVATSRINFRLLARDAQTNGKDLRIISGDGATRALAASAGLPVFVNVGEYEASLAAETGSAETGSAAATAAAAPPTAAPATGGRETAASDTLWGTAGDAESGEPAGVEATAVADGTTDPRPAGTARSGGTGPRARSGSSRRKPAKTPDDAPPSDDTAGTAAVPAPAVAAAAAAGAAATAAAAVGPAVAPASATPRDTVRSRGAAGALRPATAAPAAPARSRTPSIVPAARVVSDTPSQDRPADPLGRPTFAGRSLSQLPLRTPFVIAAAVVALALLVGGVGAYLVLPSATVVIAPRETTIGPVALRIVADPTATSPDVTAKVVPAVTKTVEVEASDRFPATGKRVEEEKASGTVRFRNKDFTSSNTIPRGSIVSTQGGIRFRTNTAVTVPRAELVGLQIFPASASVKVTAVDAGPDGNVEPNTILTIPRGEDPLTLDVTNPDATKGGTRDEFPRIVQADVDAAMTALTTRLQTAFSDRLDDPELTVDGTTVFPDTGTLGDPSFSVDVATLVGDEVEAFDLGASASGTVLAVDEAAVQTVAEANITSSVGSGFELVDGSSQFEPSPAVIDGGIVTFPVVATARQRLVVDPAAIEAEILGKPLSEARAVLERYGRVDLSVWPDWVGSIPAFDARVEVTTTSSASEGGAPSPGATP